MKISFLFILLFPLTLFAQPDMEENLNAAYQNAKKGIYWALVNIPENRKKLQSDLIDENKMYASVKLEKEYNGVKIVSKGYDNSTEVSVTVYRSLEGLIRDGYLKPPEEKNEQKLKD